MLAAFGARLFRTMIWIALALFIFGYLMEGVNKENQLKEEANREIARAAQEVDEPDEPDEPEVVVPVAEPTPPVIEMISEAELEAMELEQVQESIEQMPEEPIEQPVHTFPERRTLQ